MSILEPTYLRYVYDRLSKGSISSKNPTSIPIEFKETVAERGKIV